MGTLATEMATLLAAILPEMAPGETVEGRYLLAGRVMRVSTSIVSGRHRKAMGKAVWLYLYLEKDAQTNSKPDGVRLYMTEGSLMLGCSIKSIKKHLERLHKAGYITCNQLTSDLLCITVNPPE